jgi:hypothetical protein
MLQLSAAGIQKTQLLKAREVVGIKHVLQTLPEGLLPLENRLLSDHIRRHVFAQAARKEYVGQILFF